MVALELKWGPSKHTHSLPCPTSAKRLQLYKAKFCKGKGTSPSVHL